jgi:hypothetical protein
VGIGCHRFYREFVENVVGIVCLNGVSKKIVFDRGTQLL